MLHDFSMQSNEQFHVHNEWNILYMCYNGLTFSKWCCIPEGDNKFTQKNDSPRLGILCIVAGYIGRKGTLCHSLPCPMYVHGLLLHQCESKQVTTEYELPNKLTILVIQAIVPQGSFKATTWTDNWDCELTKITCIHIIK